VLAACDPSTSSASANGPACDEDVTAIAQIQGDGWVSPLVGTEVTIRGIVTWLDSGAGFYLEEHASDQSSTSSNALYIKDKTLAHEVKPGQRLLLTGQVAELGQARDTLTALSHISAHRSCAAGLELPETMLALPLNSRQREAVESMRISLQEQLHVSDVYNFYRGRVTLSVDGILRAPTEDLLPGKTATNAARSNRERSLRAGLSAGGNPLLRSGSSIPSASGVMGHNGREQLLLIEQPLSSDLPPPPGLSEPGGRVIRVVSLNLLNFFNGDGAGGGFPTERGAKSYDDFLARANRIQSALKVIQPALIAVQELENDGFDEFSAAQSLIDLLNEAVPGKWSVVQSKNGKIGNDLITVGLFYREDILEAVGSPHVLDSPPFSGLNRQPLAQLFRELSSGAEFIVTAIHLKSKGSCPDNGINSDQDDGQGCWNAARVEAAAALITWVRDLARNAGTGHALILGDMNSYRREDPIQTLETGDYRDLVEFASGLPQYSYVFWGQAGTLDYAFSTEALLPFVRKAQFWHINADWPQKVELPQPWLRFSDHDPIVVDLDFSQAATSD
jgi:predicted extracellular nuclease